jgi:hypothetical protein
MKSIRCFIRLHGISREIITGEFESIAAAKKWLEISWYGPYTIVRISRDIYQKKN